MKVLLRAAMVAVLVVGGVGPAMAVPRSEQCRMEQVDRAHSTHHEVVLTVRCAGRKFGSTAKALDVGQCESSLTAHDYVGPYYSTYQYLLGTFASQQREMPAVRRGYDLKRRVTNMRANVITAVAWGAKHSWPSGTWSCA